MEAVIHYHSSNFRLTGANNATEVETVFLQGLPLITKEYREAANQIVRMDYFLDEALTELAVREERILCLEEGRVCCRKTKFSYFDTAGALAWEKSTTKHFEYV
ncbi:hypothetical protein [Adhaeribacter pallidiroseus]|uniref:Uncharacterized protein n=1 Tax=Adhaeribacter pallidiroseus TaxID=2072847 RepID=A0A369QP60_9BACT|nr:hypothetical protein [Adhaeribacter pallidiroseus]RDC65066.1 hypothetical protein AHMF7616_03689 [Adhaeribacter pallidiroseus]